MAAGMTIVPQGLVTWRMLVLCPFNVELVAFCCVCLSCRFAPCQLTAADTCMTILPQRCVTWSLMVWCSDVGSLSLCFCAADLHLYFMFVTAADNIMTVLPQRGGLQLPLCYVVMLVAFLVCPGAAQLRLVL